MPTERRRVLYRWSAGGGDISLSAAVLSAPNTMDERFFPSAKFTVFFCSGKRSTRIGTRRYDLIPNLVETVKV